MARQVGDDLVILDPESGRYFGLNDVGALIWDRLADETSPDDLVDAVVAAYDVGRDQAASDVNDLLVQLAERSLLAS
jgi:predicted Rdx family selenoprotein